MKKILSLVTLLLLAGFSFAQKIEIKANTNPPYKLNQEILFTIYLINNTDKPIFYFDSQNTSWDSFIEKSELTVNGNLLEMNEFKDAHEGQYGENVIATIYPGNKAIIRYKRIQLTSPGHTVFKYSQEQSPLLVQKKYAKTPTAYEKSKKINPFKVSGSIEFDVDDIETKSITNKVEMNWNEWITYKKEKSASNNNIFGSLETALLNPDKVYTLTLNCEGLSEDMIKRIGLLTNLKELYLQNYSLNKIPVEITHLNLFELSILSNKMKSIELPKSFSNMDSLHVLFLNNFIGIPNEVVSLKKLEELTINYCSVNKLPDLSALQNLKKLSVVFSELISIESSNIDKIENLQKVDFSGNENIGSIESICKCKNIKSISFNLCRIQQIPDGINGLQNLTEIQMSLNNFSSIPESFGTLINLESIDLSNNKYLVELPKSIINLNKLKSLLINNTGIMILPEGISNLPLNYVTIYATKCKKNKDYKLLKKRLKNRFRE